MPLMNGMNGPRWYAVHTRSRFEKAVRRELTAKGIECYLPACEETHRWKDRKKVVETPVFGGYVFARFVDAEGARFQIVRTNGVVRILGAGCTIEPVADHEIEAIRRVLESGNPWFPHPSMREGSWVRVRRGALAGVEGRLLRWKNTHRLVLSIELLSQAVATEVDVADVEPAREPYF